MQTQMKNKLTLSSATFDLAENVPAGRLLSLARERSHSWRQGLQQRVDSRTPTWLGCCAGRNPNALFLPAA